MRYGVKQNYQIWRVTHVLRKPGVSLASQRNGTIFPLLRIKTLFILFFRKLLLNKQPATHFERYEFKLSLTVETQMLTERNNEHSQHCPQSSISSNPVGSFFLELSQIPSFLFYPRSV